MSTIETTIDQDGTTTSGTTTSDAITAVARDMFGWDPLRSGIASGFIHPANESLVVFIDGPGAGADEGFDWGAAALAAIDAWRPSAVAYTYDWSLKMPEGQEGQGHGSLDAT